MAEFYNDNGIPHGGFIAVFNSAGFMKVESFSPEMPGKTINRPDEIGSPNGWAGVDDQETASATVQIPTFSGSALTKGDFFISSGALHSYKWVVVGLSERYQMGDYWKVDARFQRARFS
jgi:hypothetical protein